MTEPASPTELTASGGRINLNTFHVSQWLKDALRAALRRDCVDAANDAELLAQVLAARCNAALGGF